MENFKYNVVDSELGIYLRCNDRQKAVEYVQEWHGIGPKLYILEDSEVKHFIENRDPRRD